MRAASSSRDGCSASSAASASEGPASSQPPLRLLRLAVEPGQLDLDGCRPLRRLIGAGAKIDLFGPETAQLGAELRGAHRTGICPRSDRSLELLPDRGGAIESATDHIDRRDEPGKQISVERRAPRCALDQERIGGAGAIGSFAGGERRRLGERERTGGLFDQGVPVGIDVESRRLDGSAKARYDHLGRLGGTRGKRRLTLRSRLERGEPSLLVSELGQRPRAGGHDCGHGGLQVDDEPCDARELRVERPGACAEPREQLDVEDALTEVGDLGEGRLCRSRCARGFLCLGSRGTRPAVQLDDLIGERPPPGVELEHDRLGGGAGEPQLTAIGVVPVTGLRDHHHRGTARRGAPSSTSQMPSRSLSASSGPVARSRSGRRPGSGAASTARCRPVDDNREGAELLPARPFEQLEGTGGILREHGGRTPGKRRRDRALEPGLDLERGERDLLPVRAEGAGSGWDPLTALERALEGSEALACSARPLGDVVALGGRRTRMGACLVRDLLELERGRA